MNRIRETTIDVLCFVFYNIIIAEYSAVAQIHPSKRCWEGSKLMFCGKRNQGLLQVFVMMFIFDMGRIESQTMLNCIVARIMEPLNAKLLDEPRFEQRFPNSVSNLSKNKSNSSFLEVLLNIMKGMDS